LCQADLVSLVDRPRRLCSQAACRAVSDIRLVPMRQNCVRTAVQSSGPEQEEKQTINITCSCDNRRKMVRWRTMPSWLTLTISVIVLGVLFSSVSAQNSEWDFDSRSLDSRFDVGRSNSRSSSRIDSWDPRSREALRENAAARSTRI